MSARTVKIIALRHEIENALTTAEACVILQEWTPPPAGPTRSEHDAVIARACARARRLIDEFTRAAQ